jgi:hypothetical protein
MSESDGKRGKPSHFPTVPLATAPGNALFEATVKAIGVDDPTTRWLLISVLNTIGGKPEELTPDELSNALPEVDRRLRQLMQADQADKAMTRIYHVLMGWAERG